MSCSSFSMYENVKVGQWIDKPFIGHVIQTLEIQSRLLFSMRLFGWNSRKVIILTSSNNHVVHAWYVLHMYKYHAILFTYAFWILCQCAFDHLVMGWGYFACRGCGDYAAGLVISPSRGWSLCIFVYIVVKGSKPQAAAAFKQLMFANVCNFFYRWGLLVVLYHP